MIVETFLILCVAKLGALGALFKFVILPNKQGKKTGKNNHKSQTTTP